MYFRAKKKKKKKKTAMPVHLHITYDSFWAATGRFE